MVSATVYSWVATMLSRMGSAYRKSAGRTGPWSRENESFSIFKHLLSFGLHL